MPLPPDFGKSVNSILTRGCGGRLLLVPGFSDLPTSLQSILWSHGFSLRLASRSRHWFIAWKWKGLFRTTFYLISQFNASAFRDGGTSINDVRRFSAIFDLSSTMPDDFYPIRSDILGLFWAAFLNPPTYPKIGRHLWTFPCKKISLAQAFWSLIQILRL